MNMKFKLLSKRIELHHNLGVLVPPWQKAYVKGKL